MTQKFPRGMSFSPLVSLPRFSDALFGTLAAPAATSRRPTPLLETGAASRGNRASRSSSSSPATNPRTFTPRAFSSRRKDSEVAPQTSVSTP